MSTRTGFLRIAAAAALVGFGLAGCGMMQSMGSNTETFTATMSGAQESPPVSTGGSGNAEVVYHRDTGALDYSVSYGGLSGPATAAHIHGPAAPGANAGVVVPFTNVGSSPIRGQVKITPQQYEQLAAGQWYANVHTAAHPAGEIRGQLRRR
ncbi:MAG TPA: CHRD domain-containing protein [Ramlibacter sp.]|uniref:CHRD domain-containing protein n=1 Tax=Ramlibacter sp. TaxID=1917967 RepID=UPI002D7FEE33|nr:CHRD domain-containing protein [Ramlibacter sp.]HET8744707.1 CHRD domain-containing protein [Ramlibacter sp.]